MKIYLSEGFSLIIKTLPYFFLRAALYIGIGIVSIIYFLIIGFFIKILGGKAGGLAAIIIFAATIGFIAIAKLIQRYVLYIFRAGHISVITQLIKEGKLPENVNQIQYGKEMVIKNFKDVSILFAVDQIINGILKAFNRKIVRIADWLPIPGLEALAKLFNIMINFSISFIDE